MSIPTKISTTGRVQSRIILAFHIRWLVKTRKKRVLQAIEDLGYKPNLIAQGLRVKRGNLIGLVVPCGTEHAFGAIITYVLDLAHEKGYNIIIVNSNEDPALEENYISDMLRRNINGIVVLPRSMQ